MDTRNFIAETIRKADGDHTMGAAALADAIVDALVKSLDDHGRFSEHIDALIADGWEETHDGGTLDGQDMRNIARVVLSTEYGGEA